MATPPPAAQETTATVPAGVEVDRALLAAFAPLPAVVEVDGEPASEEVIALGRMLYFETRLSKNHDLSCNSCHDLKTFGVDGQPTSPGHKGTRGGRNSPTVYNAAGHIAQFWDGRAATVEEQAKGPILNPIEMGMTDAATVERVLASIPGYVEAFDKAFGKDGIRYDNVGAAIGAFERRLLTPGRWDRYLGGDDGALSDPEKTGLLTFVRTGCTTCHAGPYLGGNMYQKAGLVEAWPSQTDLGRFEVTKAETDKMFFKVPSLRNIAKTGPYFHDGSTDKLETAVEMMARYQLGKTLTAEETTSIVAFLGALTGDVPADYITPPTAPESGPKTPRPDPS